MQMYEDLNPSRPRPLKALAKPDLFAYSYENDTTQGFKEVCNEILHRRAFYVKQLNRVRQLESSARSMYINLPLATETEIFQQAEKNWRRKKAEAEKAREGLAKLADNDQALSQEEVDAFFRRKYLPEYEGKLQAWKDGILFAAQSYGFASMLLASVETRLEDDRAFHHIQALAGLVGEERSGEWDEIKQFWIHRIFPTPEWRQQFLDSEGNLISTFALKEAAQREHDQARDKFNKATKRYGWKDDSGVAYSEAAQA